MVGIRTVELRETQKLSDIHFKVYIRYGIIWVFFHTPLISPILREFLERNDFIIFIGKLTGMTSGIWVSGMYSVDEYNKLREEFKEYGVELPTISELTDKP